MHIPPASSQLVQVGQGLTGKALEAASDAVRKTSRDIKEQAKVVDSRLDESCVFRASDQAAAKATMMVIKAAAGAKTAATVMAGLGAATIGGILIAPQLPDIILSKALGHAVDKGVTKAIDVASQSTIGAKALDAAVAKLVKGLHRAQGNPPLDERRVTDLAREAQEQYADAKASLPALGMLDISQKLKRGIQGENAYR